MLTIDHSPIFELKHVTKSYGNNMAVKDGNLRIYPGEVHALMGGNGAGKSTMIKIIAGAHQADSGEILLEGKSVAFKHPKEAMDSGIQVVYQELSLLPHLTVSENIAMPSNDIVRHGIYDWKKSDALAAEALSRLGSTTADISPHDIVSELRPDQMQMVEIARAVGQNAKIILLDEPTSSLNFEETEKLFESIRGLCNAGIGIIFVSHRMNEVRELSDRITILRDGVVIVDGVPMSEKTDEEIVSDMLGEKLNAEEKKRKDSNAFESSAEVLSISFDGYDGELTVKEGEIVGLAGLAGSGRSSVLRTIWGTKPRSDIHLRYLGEEYKPKNPMHALKKKIDLPEHSAITAEHLEKYADIVKPGDILLLCTGYGLKRSWSSDYVDNWTFLSVSGANWVVEHGVKGVAIDGMSVGGPKPEDEGGPVHKICLSKGIWYGEELYLPRELLEEKRWNFAFLPLKMERCSGAPGRAIAWVEE